MSQENLPVVGKDAEEYYGTKKIWAWREDRHDVETNEMEPGYAVVYKDGYASWSPLDAFEEAYQPLGALSFGHAIAAMNKGYRVRRSGWAAEHTFIFLVQGSKFQVNRAPLNEFFVAGSEITYNAHIDVKNADGSISTWSPWNTDVLANDWVVLQKPGKV